MATMTLEYLLQLDKTETNWGLKPTNYRTVYPNSRFDRFAVFLRDVTAYTVESPKKAVRSLGKPTWALQLDAGLYGGYWRGYEVERSLNASYAFDLGFTYWRKKHSLAWRIALGGQKIQRDLYEDNEVWYSGSSSNFTVTGLEYGFDVINNQRLRLTPSVGYNASFLFPPIPDEEDVNEPLVSDLFRYNEFHPSIALSLDLKHQPKEKTMVNQSFYHGFKIRGGLRWMQFGKDNPSLEGYQIFFSIGYGIFTYQYPHG
jgi:hypothetical protein